MDLNTIKQLMDMLQQSQLTVLEVQEENLRIRMEQHSGQLHPDVLSTPSAPSADAEPPPAADSAPPVPDDSIRELRSPMVGTFHVPKDGIKVGDVLKKGQSACIIEAMKLMNSIDMPDDGEIVWIAVKEGDMVEFDQLLFSYKI